MTKTVVSKTDKLVRLLNNNKRVTAAQIVARTGLLNPTAAISRLRLDEGYPIVATQERGKTFYSLSV